MELWKHAKEALKKVKSAVVKEQEAPVAEEAAPVVEEKTEEMNLAKIINKNIKSGKHIADKIEEFRCALNKTERFAEQMENIDKMLKAIQDKLSAAVDVMVDAESFDRSAEALIDILVGYADRCSTELWTKGFSDLCSALIKDRFSGSLHAMKQTELAMDIVRLEISLEVEKKALAGHTNRKIELSKKMIEFLENNKDTVQLNTLDKELNMLIMTTKNTIEALEGLKGAYEEQLETIKSISVDISPDELAEKIGALQKESAAQLEAKAAELAKAHELNLMTYETIRLSEQKIADMLPGISLEAEMETARIVNAAMLAEQEQQTKEKQIEEQEIERTEEAEELLNN